MAREQKLLAVAHMPAVPMQIEPPDEDIKPALLYSSDQNNQEEDRAEASSGTVNSNVNTTASDTVLSQGKVTYYQNMVTIISPPTNGDKSCCCGKRPRWKISIGAFLRN